MTDIHISAGAIRRAADLARELIDGCSHDDPSPALTRVFNEVHDDAELSAATLFACASLASGLAHGVVLAQLGRHDARAVAIALDAAAGRMVEPQLKLVVSDPEDSA